MENIKSLSGSWCVSDLLSLERESFIFAAYVDLLGRTPDAEGLAHYLNRMRDGMGKDEIILELLRSEEGEQMASDLSGLATLTKTVGRRRSLLRCAFEKLGSALFKSILCRFLRMCEWTITDRAAEQQRSLALLIETTGAELREAFHARLERIELIISDRELQIARLARLETLIHESLQVSAPLAHSRADVEALRIDQVKFNKVIDEEAIQRLRVRLDSV